MTPVIIGIILLSLGGVFFSQIKMTTKDDTKVDQIVSVDSNDSTDSTVDPSPSPTSLPTIPPIKPDNSPTSSPVLQNQTDWNYPGANPISSNNGTSVFESSDDPQTITDWYKNKINQLGLNAKSFVQTNTNNQILNKLAGASSSINVDIEIKKNPEDSKTQITLTLGI